MPKMNDIITEMWSKIALADLQGNYDELQNKNKKLQKQNKKMKKKLKNLKGQK